MSFAAHTIHVERFCNELKKLPTKTPIEQLLHETLEHICAHYEHFDTSINATSPFYAEFFQGICQEIPSDELYFELLECLVIFCRERQLQSKADDTLPAIEKALLDFFEKSHHWDIEEHTKVHQWYWHELPTVYKQAVKKAS